MSENSDTPLDPGMNLDGDASIVVQENKFKPFSEWNADKCTKYVQHAGFAKYAGQKTETFLSRFMRFIRHYQPPEEAKVI